MNSSRNNAESSSSVYNDKSYSDYGKGLSEELSGLSNSSLFDNPSNFVKSTNSSGSEINMNVDNTNMEIDSNPNKNINNPSDSEEVDLESDLCESSVTNESDANNYVEMKDSVDSQFIEAGDVSITKSHNLGGVSVTAKSVNSDYRSNVFNSLFNKKK